MATLKKFRPITPSQREKGCCDGRYYEGVAPQKNTINSLKKTAGRNSSRKITFVTTGRRSKQKYRLVDFKRAKLEIPATVKSIEHDPIRSVTSLL